MSSLLRSEPPFDYSASRYPVRDDIPEAHRRAWVRLAAPGCWWTGAERVALAAASRAAAACALCRDRRSALSPFQLDGEHETSPGEGVLPPAAVDTVHRIVTDASRLTRAWFEKLAAQGLSDGHYVELLGVVVSVLSIDRLHDGIGVAREPLPVPVPGAPSRYRPPGARPEGAWVPTIPSRAARGAEAGLYGGLPATGNVLKALSLVPDAVRQLGELSSAHYLPFKEMMRFDTQLRALQRAQIELVAGRVSALNECFY
jgi:hypothetical protein